MDPATFLTELKRRKVYRVAVAYAIVAWLLIQAASILFPTFEAPLWVMKVFVTAVILGFPVALILAWAFELTPEGIRRAEEVAPREAKTPKAGRKWTAIIVAAAVLAAVLLALQFARTRSPAAEPGKQSAPTATLDKSVAVLPFENASSDPNAEYLAEGISEALINSLTELRELKVVARATAFHYRGKEVDPQRIGRELQVTTVLSGKVRQVQDALSVQVDLIDAATGAQVWGQSYERKLSDVVAVKQAIAREVTEKLRVRLTGEEERRLVQRDTTNAEAYQFYLKGRYFWNKRTAKGLEKGISYFHQSIATDPTYALAYVGLADSYSFLGAFGIAVLTPKDAMPKAKAAAAKALEIDNSLAEAHASLAFVQLYYEWDWPGAEKSFQRAIELNPNYAPAHQWYSHLLMSRGRTNDSISRAKRAAEIDPLSLPAIMNVGWQYDWSRQYDSSVEWLRKVLEIEPNFEQARWALGLAYEGKGMIKEAATEFQKAVDLSGGNPVYEAALGRAYAIGGNKPDAMRICDQLEKESKSKYVSAYWMATLQVGLANKGAAFQWLEKAYEERSGGMIWLSVDPRMDGLRSDARFATLLDRLGVRP
jgi:TolB-like protein/Flp pilus assembly protein TadD